MEELKYWRIRIVVVGGLNLPGENHPFSPERRSIDINRHTKYTENFSRAIPKILEVKVKIDVKEDHVRMAFEFSELLLTVIMFALEPYSRFCFLSVKEQHPDEEDKENYYESKLQLEKIDGEWQPVMHNRDLSNLIVSFAANEGGSMAELNERSIEIINEHWDKYLKRLENLDSKEKRLVSYYKEGMILRNLKRPNESFTTMYKIVEQFIREEGSGVVEEIKKEVQKDLIDLVLENTTKPMNKRLRADILDFAEKELIEKGRELSPERHLSEYVRGLVEKDLRKRMFSFIARVNEIADEQTLRRSIQEFLRSENWKNLIFTNKKVIEHLSEISDFEEYLKTKFPEEKCQNLMSSLHKLPSKRGILSHPQIGDEEKEIDQYDRGACRIFARHLLLSDLLKNK